VLEERETEGGEREREMRGRNRDAMRAKTERERGEGGGGGVVEDALSPCKSSHERMERKEGRQGGERAKVGGKVASTKQRWVFFFFSSLSKRFPSLSFPLAHFDNLRTSIGFGQ